MQEVKPQFCYTASGVLIVDQRVLLLKHKKLGTWLTPGGHVEEGEFLYQAAEREFFEETGLKVEAISYPSFNLDFLETRTNSCFHPVPISINLHWISKKNYQYRLAGQNKREKKWPKGCEQHLDFQYLLASEVDLTALKKNSESEKIAWFSLEEIKKMSDEEIFKQVRAELILAFKLKAN
ncbi:MAG: NUDIX domain-containing protein [Candidatus Pacebacteria bacterium]|jgi:8-oxo-dGTP pyrophosphatase MutT (NUDIX family)|nr:NUDIX domain-containing protein [Candidatus Paceibacterota bacterium]